MKTAERVIAHRPEAQRRCVACGQPWPCPEVADMTMELDPVPAPDSGPLTRGDIWLLIAVGLVVIGANVMIVLSAVRPDLAPW